MRVVAYDTETFYDKDYSVRDLGNWRYCHDKRFDPYLISVYDGDESWAGNPRDFNWDALEGAYLVSHNAAFDQNVTEAMIDRGIAPRVKLAGWGCSANLSSYLCNRRSLAQAAEHLLKVRVPKAMRDWMKGKTWGDAVLARKDKELIAYAIDDVIRCREVWMKGANDPIWQARESALSDLTIRQCARGVAINVEKLERYIGVLVMVVHYLEKSLPWVAEGKKITSPKAINEQCRRVGIPCPPIKSHDGGEEAFLLWEQTYAPKFGWVSNVGQWRSINKVLTTLRTIQERLRPDGTIDFSLLYFGAHTGRWSGGGSGLNLQNLRKDPIYVFDDYKVESEQVYTEEEIKELKIREVVDVRSLFVPRPGHQFCIADLSQIEPRVLRWCAGDARFLEMVAQGYSPYEAAARTSPSIKWIGGDLKREDYPLYQRVKINELGLGYGCGAVKFQSLAAAWGRQITGGESALEVETWRDSNPRIVKLWNELDTAFKRSIGKTFELELPSGRTLTYGRVAYQSRPYKDAETGKTKFRQVLTADVGGMRKSLYGGLLTENLVQATARDVFAEHLLALDAAGVDTVFTVHDEAVTEVPTGTDPREVEEIMSKTPEWLAGCPIAAEAQIADRYKK